MTNENLIKRLSDATQRCITNYETWQVRPKDVPLRQQLEEAVHELRKVTARIEIEIAVSDRSDKSQKPIPIPAHRSSQPKGGDNRSNNNDGYNGEQDSADNDDDFKGNSAATEQQQAQKSSSYSLSMSSNSDDKSKQRSGGRKTLKTTTLRRKSED